MSHSPHAVLATLLVALALTACGGGATATVPVQPPTSLAQTPTTPVPTPTTRSAELTTLNEGLRAAAWTNDVTEARRLITLGADVNAKDETQQSTYLIATSEGYLDLLRLTLAHGAKVDAKDSWNGTGLIRAAERGHALVVGELLRAGIARDHINRIGYQAIHEAVWLGDDTPEYATTVRVLAAGGVELDRRAPSAELTPLEMARQIGHTGAAGILETITSAARPADPDAALLQAAEVGDANAVAIALRAGANIEARDAHDRTALLLAATYDQIPVANVLVAMGASPNALDDRHDTPWLVTGVTGSVAMLEACLLYTSPEACNSRAIEHPTRLAATVTNPVLPTTTDSRVPAHCSPRGGFYRIFTPAAGTRSLSDPPRAVIRS